jgi:hypothetical protein
MRFTVPLGANDFTPLAGFALAWRWTDRRWNLLPDTALASIRPLSQPAARRAWLTLKPLFHPHDWALNPEHFDALLETDTRDDAAPVREWLGRVVPPGGDVLVLWDPAVAVLTTEPVFRTYWDDFCYPSSDDVQIWPLSDAWAASYFHEEVMKVGIRER